MPSSQGPLKLLQDATNTTNDLSQLLPVGTLNFIDLPLRKSDLFGVPVDHNGSSNSDVWRWLDIAFLLHITGKSVHPALLDLEFLINFRFAMATFQVFRVPLSPKKYLAVAKVRIYGLPNDNSAARKVKEWRMTRRQSLRLQKRFQAVWLRMLGLLDFSDNGWKSPPSLASFLNKGAYLLPFSDHSAEIYPRIGLQNHRIERWVSNGPVSVPNMPNHHQYSLRDRVQGIYNSIRSPDLSKYKQSIRPEIRKAYVPSSEETLARLTAEARSGGVFINGVLSELYPFQVKSLCKMFEKETTSTRSLVPNFIRLRSPGSSEEYFFDILGFAFYALPELYHLPKGGILAENMGLGKTLICLSLVCLTKYDFSAVPGQRLLYVGKEEERTDISLSSLCRKSIVQNSLPWKYYIDDLPSSVVAKLNSSPGFFRVPLEGHYSNIPAIKTRNGSARRREMDLALSPEGVVCKTLYLCNTTLVIVPDNLFHQWNGELKKHIQASFLRKLFVSSQFSNPIQSKNALYMSSLPEDPRELLEYDLILVSHTLLIRQTDKTSPLHRIFWKRLIIDEGHSTSSRGTRTSLLCRDVFSERRWAVTGTPTSGLTRLHMDEEQSKKESKSAFSERSSYVVKSSFNEKEDLVKLGNIVCNFLQIEPFFSQPKLWTLTIIQPLTQGLSEPGTALSNLLNSIMVRHNLSDIDGDISLPQLHHQPVYLEPSYHNRIAINLFTAVLAVNAVSSERKDIDYMFHPANRQQLRRLVTNLQRASFHWTGFKQEDVETLISICDLLMKKEGPDGAPYYGIDDRKLIERLVEAAMEALNNGRWRTSALLHEMSLYVGEIPEFLTKSFSTGVLGDDIGVFGAPHLHAIQEFFYKHRFMDLSDKEKAKNVLNDAVRPFWRAYWDDTTKRNAERFKKQDTSQDLKSVSNNDVLHSMEPGNLTIRGVKRRRELESKPKEAVKNVVSRDFAGVKEIESVMRNGENGHEENRTRILDEMTQKKGNTGERGEKHAIFGSYHAEKVPISGSEQHPNHTHSPTLSLASTAQNATLLGTASSKLSYLASRLMEHQQDGTKSLVFFEFEDSAYYLTELLDVLGVNYIMYATFVSPSQRATNLLQFSSHSAGGMALVMDLRLASHGLTIIAATRVYFINPVWQRSVEAQAIKRAHRIGQKNEVFVETLILKDTIEEEIYRRRSQRKQDEDKTQKRYVIDDTGMQEFILRHQFLSHDYKKEYAPFSAPTYKEGAFCGSENTDFSLPHHQDSVSGHLGALERLWKMYLFNADNLGKMNLANNQRLAKEYASKDFIRKFVDSEDEEEKEERMRSVKKKKVRF